MEDKNQISAGSPEAVRPIERTNERMAEVVHLILPTINSIRDMAETSHRTDEMTEAYHRIAERVRMENEAPRHILATQSPSANTLTMEP